MYNYLGEHHVKIFFNCTGEVCPPRHSAVQCVPQVSHRRRVKLECVQNLDQPDNHSGLTQDSGHTQNGHSRFWTHSEWLTVCVKVEEVL